MDFLIGSEHSFILNLLMGGAHFSFKLYMICKIHPNIYHSVDADNRDAVVFHICINKHSSKQCTDVNFKNILY